VNVSLDTLDREQYRAATGRDLLPEALAGIDSASSAGFELIKLNCVLMRGRNEDQLAPLVEYAAERNLLLRFIELMPVSTSEVLEEANFLPIRTAQRQLEARYGPLMPEPQFRTNGPASYYQIPGRNQRIGFIGAMTNLHFCESCNKLRPDVRWETAAVSRELSGVRHHESDARGRERRRAGAVLPRCRRTETAAARLPRELPAGAEDGGDRRLTDEPAFAYRCGWQRADGGRFGEADQRARGDGSRPHCAVG
jgi:hypothetical protein